MRPLQPRMSKRRNLAIAAIIWISSSLISCPMLLFFKTEEVRIWSTVCRAVITFSPSLSLSIHLCILLPQGASNQAEQLPHSLLLRVARWTDQFLQARIFVSIQRVWAGRTYEFVAFEIAWSRKSGNQRNLQLLSDYHCQAECSNSLGCHKISP